MFFQALEKLLKQSLEASTLLVYKGGAIDGDSARNLLVAEIAKEMLRINKDNTLRGELYCRWANAIKGLFPDENTTAYYVPACTTANGQRKTCISSFKSKEAITKIRSTCN